MSMILAASSFCSSIVLFIMCQIHRFDINIMSSVQIVGGLFSLSDLVICECESDGVVGLIGVGEFCWLFMVFFI